MTSQQPPSLPPLDDPTRCPSCAFDLRAASGRCPSCGIDLTGPAASRLWDVSVQAAALLRTREQLIVALRSEVGAPPAAAVPVDVPVVPRPARDPEMSRRKVQNLLLALGVGLLAVAAVVFLVVSWDRLGVGGRSAVMAGATVTAGLSAYGTHRRGLSTTAEWLSLLTVCLGVLDGYGARASGLAGSDHVDGAAYWAGATAVVALGAVALSRAVPSRTLLVSTAVLGLLPVPLLGVSFAQHADHPIAVLGAAMTAQVLLAAAAVLWMPVRGSGLGAVRVVLGVGGLSSMVVASALAAAAAFAEDGSLLSGTVLLLVLAGCAAAAGTVLAARKVAPALVGLGDVAAVGLLVLAVWAPVDDRSSGPWSPVAFAGSALVLLAAALLVPSRRRPAPAVVALVAVLLPCLGAVDSLTAVLRDAVRASVEPWSTAADLVTVGAHGPGAALLGILGAGLLLGPGVPGRPLLPRLLARLGPVLGLPALVGGLALLPGAVGSSYSVALGALVALAAAGLGVGGLLDGRGRVAVGRSLLGSGAVLLVLTLGWSLAAESATLATLPAAVGALLVGAVAARASDALRTWRLVLVVAAALVALAWAAAVARHLGAGWPATWSLTLGLLVVVALAFAVAATPGAIRGDRLGAVVRAAAVPVATVAVVADAGAVTRWSGASATWGSCGLAAAVVAAVLIALVSLAHLGGWDGVVRLDGLARLAQIAAGAAALPALVGAAQDPDRLWVALLAVGLAVAVLALELPRWGWASAALLTASSWVRLDLSHVDAPEAYTVPAAVALLVLGAVRRRRDPAASSWRSYGGGLALGLGPSLVRAVTDAGDLRPLLLAVAAAIVVGAGVRGRLQAPLVVGAVVLALDALVQLAPVVAAAYSAVPRWVTLGTLGLVLVACGATYEHRVRDLRRVGARVAGLS